MRRALWMAPAWYHAASLVILAPHWLDRLVYLIALTGVGLLAAVRWDAMWPRVLLWAAVAVPLLGWAGAVPADAGLAPSVVAWLAIGGMHAAAQVELTRRVRTRLHPADVMLVPVNGIGLYVGLHAVLTAQGYALDGPVAAGLAAGAVGLTLLLRRIEPRAAPHFLVAAVTLVVIAGWPELGGAWVIAAVGTQGAGLAWLGLGERRDWIRLVGGTLLAGALIGLLRLQLTPVPAGYDVFLNQRTALGLALVGLLALVAWWHGRIRDDADPGARAGLAIAVVTANLAMLLTLSTEIDAFWELRSGADGPPLAGRIMLSATWAAYAAALTAAGIRRRYPPVRYLAIVLFGITVLKVFVVDFSQLDAAYRIASSMALGVLLLGASYLYQRFGTDDADPPATTLVPTGPDE